MLFILLFENVSMATFSDFFKKSFQLFKKGIAGVYTADGLYNSYSSTSPACLCVWDRVTRRWPSISFVFFYLSAYYWLIERPWIYFTLRVLVGKPINNLFPLFLPLHHLQMLAHSPTVLDNNNNSLVYIQKVAGVIIAPVANLSLNISWWENKQGNIINVL